jgi:hypothetical protein
MREHGDDVDRSGERQQAAEGFDARYASGRFAGPSGRGYIHVAAQVRAPSHPGPLFRRPQAHAALLARLKDLGGALRAVDGVEDVAVFDAVVISPPGEYDGEWGAAVRPPHFDVVVLVETRSPDVARAVQGTEPFHALLGALRDDAKRMHVVVAHDEQRLADVAKLPGGLFAFHYFVAAEVASLRRVWECTTRFHELETGLTNGVLLVPEPGETSDYVAIDLARWDVGLLKFIWRQVSNQRAWTNVRRGMHLTRVGAMPILYRLA